MKPLPLMYKVHWKTLEVNCQGHGSVARFLCWDMVVGTLELIIEFHAEETFRDEFKGFGMLLNSQVTMEKLEMARSSILLHIVQSLGMQQCNVACGSVVQQVSRTSITKPSYNLAATHPPLPLS